MTMEKYFALKLAALTVFAVMLLSSCGEGSYVSSAQSPEEMRDMSSQEIVEEMNIG